MFEKGAKKPENSGRKPGSVNRIKQISKEKAEELGIDPFEILLLFAANRWYELGYNHRTTIITTESGTTYEKDVITPELRVQAAKEAVQYLIPKQRALDVSGNINVE